MLEGLLPIGSVVLLKNSTKRVMIIGVLQRQNTEEGPKLWDYSGCPYPEGYIGPDRSFLFNAQQIEKIFAIGYQDAEQFAFKVKVDELRRQMRAGEKGPAGAQAG